ncbi:acyltransferase family protein [Massilistercora timonensis]|uniref:acyltransferase family protein n=1 Tax=Massilistercora timonensis TaxID=2086584 RepID=UPI00320989EE
MKKIEKDTRNYLFDNIKLFLIFLVVSVHLLAAVSEYTDTNFIVQLYTIGACSFHMPLFMFISGHFTKMEKSRSGAIDVLILYVIAQIILLIADFGCTGKISLADAFFPAFSMWYLAVLFVLRYVLQDIIKIKHVLMLSAFLSIVVMGVEMSGEMEKTVVKLFANAVYFLLGFYTTDEMIGQIRGHKWSKIVGGIMLLVGGACIYAAIISKIVDPHILRIMMLRSTYVAKLDWGIWGYLLVACILFLAIWMSFAIIIFFPKRKFFFTFLGKYTNTIYIGQAVLYLVFRQMLKKHIIEGSGIELYIWAMGLSVVCVIVFGNKYLSEGLKRIMGLIRRFGVEEEPCK